MTFPVDGQIENTKWDRLARRCLPTSDCPDINRIGKDFVNYLHFHGVSIHHHSVYRRFQYFCNHLANRNHD